MELGIIHGLTCLGENRAQTIHIRVDTKIETDVISIHQKNQPKSKQIVNRDVVRIGQRYKIQESEMMQGIRLHQAGVVGIRKENNPDGGAIVNRDVVRIGQRYKSQESDMMQGIPANQMDQMNLLDEDGVVEL